MIKQELSQAVAPAVTTTIFQLVGGPWDGQTLSTASDDESNACFAQALLAITGARLGHSVPLLSPASQAMIKAGMTDQERRSLKPHSYEIVDTRRREAALFITARHCSRQ